MKSDAGKNDSIWTITADIPPRPPIAGDDHASVLVVGAGIAGLTTAYIAAKEGKSVIVLDDGPIWGGETGRTTAHLSNALDDRYFEDIADALDGVEEWLLTGPGTAKSEMARHVGQHRPGLQRRLCGLETSDHPSAVELVDQARWAFASIGRPPAPATGARP